METWDVILTKEYIVTGVMKIKARTAEAAQAKIEKMMADPKKPLQTLDPRIEWDEPEYVDYSFAIEDVQ